MEPYKIIISGGGTGGHIYPAIAIAQEFLKKHPSSDCLFVGALGKMEMQKVPEAGFKIIGLPVRGIQRRLTLKNLRVPFLLLKSLWMALKILKQHKPDFVLGTGGYASFPLLCVAFFKRVPYFVQEQNSFAGVANKILARGARKVFVSYDGMEAYFPKGKIVKTGNPIREGLFPLQETALDSRVFFGLDPDRKTLLVLGGSLGARAINRLISSNIDFLKTQGFQILWQCGSLYFSDYEKFQSTSVKVLPFIKDMSKAYAAADVVISRAGAIAISELCAVGKPVILIPSPHLAEDHQTKNAQTLAAKNAAILLKESELDLFQEKLLAVNSEKQLAEMAQNIKKMAMPQAASHIVEQLIKDIR